jgi:hypothetical protein
MQIKVKTQVSQRGPIFNYMKLIIKKNKNINIMFMF